MNVIEIPRRPAAAGRRRTPLAAITPAGRQQARIVARVTPTPEAGKGLRFDAGL